MRQKFPKLEEVEMLPKKISNQLQKGQNYKSQ
jgi:hypothetical protein